MNPKVFKKAQSRGWMKCWEFEREDEHYYMGTLYVFKQVEKGKWLSLNDILFGTDFCEKYFDAFCKYPCCEEALYYGEPKQHQQAMLSMSEPERIDFLYKHVEKDHTEQTHEMVEEEKRVCTQCLLEENTGVCDKPSCKNYQEPQPVDVKEIEPIPFKEYSGSVTHVVQSVTGDLTFKINELVKAFNAHVKDCKLNRN